MSLGDTPSGEEPVVAPATMIVDRSGFIVSVTPRLAQMFGFAADDLPGKCLDLLLPSAEEESTPTASAQHTLRRLTTTGASRVRARTAAGAHFDAEISAIPLPGADGIAISIHQQPWELPELSTTLIESAPDGLVITDTEGRIVLVNAQTERLFGYSQNELLGQMVEVLVPPTLRTHHERLRTGYARNPVARPMAVGRDLFAIRRDGSQFPVDVSLSWIQERGTYLISTWIRDVTERRRIDDELIMLAGIVHSSDDAVVSCTLSGTVTSWNRSAEKLLGYGASEMLGCPMSIIVPGQQLSELEGLLTAIGHGERVDVHEGVRIRKDGSVVDVSISMSPIHDRRDALVGAATVFRDNSRSKLVERNLLAARDAAEASSHALEAFSYSVAHDLRAPLRAIDGFSRILAEDYEDRIDEQGQSYLRHIRTSSRDMSQLVEGLLHLAKVSHRELVVLPFDLSAGARRVLARLSEADPDRVVRVLVADGLRAPGDPVLLANVLENLLQNAWKFSRDRADAQIEFGQDEDGFFIRDNGAGFDMKHASKLFGVFQRCHTNEEFEGTGIGLATVKRIIERHGGRIWATGAVGEGAEFRFTLPSDEVGGPGPRSLSATDPVSLHAGSYSPTSSTAAS